MRVLGARSSSAPAPEHSSAAPRAAAEDVRTMPSEPPPAPKGGPSGIPISASAPAGVRDASTRDGWLCRIRDAPTACALAGKPATGFRRWKVHDAAVFRVYAGCVHGAKRIRRRLMRARRGQLRLHARNAPAMCSFRFFGFRQAENLRLGAPPTAARERNVAPPAGADDATVSNLERLQPRTSGYAMSEKMRLASGRPTPMPTRVSNGRILQAFFVTSEGSTHS